MRLQTRVLLAQLPALVVVVLLLVFGGATVERLGGQGPAVLRDNYRSVLAAQRMKESVERLDSAALFCLAERCDRGQELVRTHRPAFEGELKVEEGNLTEPGEAAAAQALRAAWDHYVVEYDRFLQAPPAEAHDRYFDHLYPAFVEVKTGADRVLALNQDAMVRKSEAAEAAAAEARTRWALVSIVGLVGAVALGVALAARLTGPLRQLAASARDIGEGQLGARLPGSSVAELASLVAAFNQMAERLRLYRRAADSELARTREAAQAAIESLVDPVLVLTVKGELRATNRAARACFSLRPGARHLHEGDPALRAAVEAAHAEVVARGVAVLPIDFSGVVLGAAPDGEHAWLVHATPLHDAVTGELVGVTVLLRDVTRLRHLDELKGNLVHTVAHELRTPLTSLGMALHLALDERVGGPLEPRLAELLTAARDDTRRLRALVEDLLDLSRLQAGGAGPAATEVPPAELLAEVGEAARRAAEEAGVRLEVEARPGLPPVRVDRARMRVALLNLVVNAVRHSPAGGVVRLSAAEVTEALRFTVEDEGPGVPAAERGRIFEAFVRGEGETGEGAGLGLHIAREVVRGHGGEIGVEGAAEGGARFWIELPRAATERPGGGGPPAP